MNESNINIKARNSNMLIQGISFLVMTVVSLLIALMPYLSEDAMKISTVFFIVGGIMTAVFLSLFVFVLYKECKPADAMILNSRGFIDTKNVGENILIEWTNVASVKILGKKDMPFFGITLENSDIVLARMKDKNADEMRENIEENLPHILISQKDIRTPVKEVNDLFVKFVREARILCNDVPKKTKNNPFTTDDVLRAFGKLPKKEEEKSSSEPEALKQNTAESAAAQEHKAPEAKEEAVQDSDTFYSLLQNKVKDETAQAEAIEETAEEANEITTNEVINDAESDGLSDEAEIKLNEDEIPDEMKAILSKPKSSKIAELEKILNEKDAPITHLRRPAKTENEKLENESIEIQPLLDSENADNLSDSSENIDDIEISLFPLSEETPFKKEKSKPMHDEKTDTKEFIPDSFISEIPSDDDSDFIIPDPIEYNEEE